MRQDLLKIIKSSKDITHAFILTHNIDFLFIQAVVIPALRACGSPSLTIFADSQCAVESYQDQFRFLSDLGLRYRVVPITMEAGFRFHPKAVFLSGLKQGILLIGSGNLTFGGWRENGEVWIRHDAVGDGLKALWAFREYLRNVLDLCDESQSIIRAEVEEAFDYSSRNWAALLEPGDLLIGHAGKGESLLPRMINSIETQAVEHLYVCTPFFDKDAEALKALASSCSAKRTSVLIQNGYTNMLADVAATLDESFSLQSVRFEHGTTSIANVRSARLHAKFIAFELDKEVIVFAGSANCSKAAITIPGAFGNAELMSRIAMTPEAFRAEFLSELVLDPSAPILMATTEDNPTGEIGVYIRVELATNVDGRIDVHFKAAEGVSLHKVIVDHLVLIPIESADAWARLNTDLTQPRTISLVGLFEGVEITSPQHWIDDEIALRVSARGRSLAESISGLVRPDSWSVGAWTNVLAELYKHLEYMPKAFVRSAGQSNSKRKPNASNTFTWGDVFSPGYGLPIGPVAFDVPLGLNDRIGSLRSMLLRWFGIGTDASEAAQPATRNDESMITLDSNGDEETDSPEPLHRATLLPPPAATAKEHAKALKLIDQVTDRLAAGEFLSERPPSLLSRDVKVAALLLRAGFSDGWLTTDEFFSATLKIWLPLFFSAGAQENTGWIEQRYLTDFDPEQFASDLSSVDLSAALACWALSIEERVASPAHARFVLASALGVARLPWLWQCGGNQQIARQVSDALSCMGGIGKIPWNDVQRRWLKLIRRGYALNRLQSAIGNRSVVHLAGLIKQTKVDAGELLWQGAYGFCIANTDCSRSADDKCEVLLLQQGDSKRKFSPSLLVPLDGLLSEDLLEMDALPSNARAEILALLSELHIGLKKQL